MDQIALITTRLEFDLIHLKSPSPAIPRSLLSPADCLKCAQQYRTLFLLTLRLVFDLARERVRLAQAAIAARDAKAKSLSAADMEEAEEVDALLNNGGVELVQSEPEVVKFLAKIFAVYGD